MVNVAPEAIVIGESTETDPDQTVFEVMTWLPLTAINGAEDILNSNNPIRYTKGRCMCLDTCTLSYPCRE